MRYRNLQPIAIDARQLARQQAEAARTALTWYEAAKTECPSCRACGMEERIVGTLICPACGSSLTWG